MLQRFHELPSPEFDDNLNKFLNRKFGIKNHFIIGDFNIDIFKQNLKIKELLNSLLEKGFYPDFICIFRPSDFSENRSCIDNIFTKTSSNDTKT